MLSSVYPCPCRSRVERKAQDLPHLEYPWGWQVRVGKARTLCPAAWVALVHVLPTPHQSCWLNSSAVAPSAYSWAEEGSLETFRSAPGAFNPQAHPHQQATTGKRWQPQLSQPQPSLSHAKETSSLLILPHSIRPPNHPGHFDSAFHP